MVDRSTGKSSFPGSIVAKLYRLAQIVNSTSFLSIGSVAQLASAYA